MSLHIKFIKDKNTNEYEKLQLKIQHIQLERDFHAYKKYIWWGINYPPIYLTWTTSPIWRSISDSPKLHDCQECFGALPRHLPSGRGERKILPLPVLTSSIFVSSLISASRRHPPQIRMMLEIHLHRTPSPLRLLKSRFALQMASPYFIFDICGIYFHT